MKRSSFLLYLHSIASGDLSPATVPSCANLPVIAKSMSWIQKFRYARCSETRHIDRYKDAPSRTLPRQTFQLKPMHSRSSRPLPWFPMRRVSRNEGSPGGRWPAHWFRAEASYSKSEAHRALVSIFHFTSTVGQYQLSFQSVRNEQSLFFPKKNVRNECPKRICTSTE